jgi:hypothetical protein
MHGTEKKSDLSYFFLLARRRDMPPDVKKKSFGGIEKKFGESAESDKKIGGQCSRPGMDVESYFNQLTGAPMTTLQQRAYAGTLQLTIPYAFKDAFREVFKTASWNPSLKIYEVKDTAQNRNKWDKFLALAQEPLKAFALADESEASAEDLRRVAQRLEDALASARQRIERANDEAIAARVQAEELAPLLEAATQKLAVVTADANSAKQERDALVAPILELYAVHQLDQIIGEYLAGASRGFSGKARCEAAEGRLISLRKEMRRIGYEVTAMSDLIAASLNRPEKVYNAAEALQRMKVTGIKAYVRAAD